MNAPITHVLPVTIIRRERFLPIPGRVVVRKGQKVSPTEVIAEANLAPEHILLDVARGLGLPAAKADQYIQRTTNEELGEGDIIAGPVGLTRRVVRAPCPGKVVLTGNGQVLLEVESHPYELRAGMPGVVVDLLPDLGAIIETNGALVQGVWGNGQIDFGLMHVLLRKQLDELTHDQLDVSLRGSVVLGGYCEEPEALEAAGELPVRGLILASMAATLLPLAAKQKYPILILEGFGFLPLNTASYKLLSTSERREITVNAEAWDRSRDSRPEVIIPLPVAIQPQLPVDNLQFAPEQRVRVIHTPWRSLIGTLVAIRPGLSVFPSGIRAPGAQVRLENGDETVLPLVNLEVLD
jgi:hypothetical protein